MHIHRTVRVKVINPNAHLPSEATGDLRSISSSGKCDTTGTPQEPLTMHMEDRTFFAYRNMGFALTHFGATTDDPRLGNSVMPSASIAHPVAIENFEQLVAYHKPSFVYYLASRRTYHVPTYQTFLSLIADPLVPFTSPCQLLPEVPLRIRHSKEECDSLRKGFTKETGLLYMVPSDLRFDAVASFPPHAGAFITSCDALTTDFVAQFVRSSRYSYHWFQKAPLHAKTERAKEAWSALYADPSSRKRGAPMNVHLYIGVGPREFGDTVAVSPADSSRSASLAHMAQRASIAVERPQRIDERWLPSDAVTMAAKWGVQILQRHNMRYFRVCL